LRPVLFIDTPPKTFDPDWRTVGLPAFEDEMRAEVSQILAPGEVSEVGSVVSRMVGDPVLRERLEGLRDHIVFNPGRSAMVGADLILDVASRAQARSLPNRD
jgi:hypothetical protein